MREPASSRPKLAIYGGTPAIRRPARERWRWIGAREIAAILRRMIRDVNTVADGRGPIAAFEKRFAGLCGTRYALAMNSGTATLHSAYFAVGAAPGTEVIVPAYTFPASVTPLLQLGATPVFCDIDERTLTADPADVERLITPRTRAICVVHLWGNPGRLDAFVEIARRHRVALIEDASHAPGARYLGRPVGSWGDIGCFSLQGSKAVSGGEAGIATTDDPVLFDRMLALGHYGRTGGGQAAGTFAIDGLSFGIKYRPHLYAILLAGGCLDRLPELNRLRRRHYAILEEELAGCDALEPVGAYEGAERGGFLSFLLRFSPERAGGWSREAFVAAARAEGVPANVDRYTCFGKRWSVLPDAPIFSALDTSGLGGAIGESIASYRRLPRPEVPAARCLAGQLISVPAFTRVPEDYVRDCARALRKVAEAAREIDDHRDPYAEQPPAAARPRAAA